VSCNEEDDWLGKGDESGNGELGGGVSFVIGGKRG